MDRGIRVHKQIEDWLKGAGPWPTEPRAIDKFAGCYADLKARNPIVEQQWGFNAKLQATGWFDKSCWYRATLDAAAADAGYCVVVDHKTGKPWGSNTDQMEQFGVAVFARYFDVHEVDTRLWYVDTGEEVAATFKRQDYTKLRDKWFARAAPMFVDTTFAPRPGRHCNRCHYRKSNGGPCAFA